MDAFAALARLPYNMTYERINTCIQKSAETAVLPAANGRYHLNTYTCVVRILTQ